MAKKKKSKIQYKKSISVKGLKELEEKERLAELEEIRTHSKGLNTFRNDISSQRKIENVSKSTKLTKRFCNLFRKARIHFRREEVFTKDEYNFYLADFYIPQYKLILELDGSHHYTDPKQIQWDKDRDDWFLSQGIAIVRIPNKVGESMSLKQLLNLIQ